MLSYRTAITTSFFSIHLLTLSPTHKNTHTANMQYIKFSLLALLIKRALDNVLLARLRFVASASDCAQLELKACTFKHLTTRDRTRTTHSYRLFRALPQSALRQHDKPHSISACCRQTSAHTDFPCHVKLNWNYCIAGAIVFGGRNWRVCTFKVRFNIHKWEDNEIIVRLRVGVFIIACKSERDVFGWGNGVKQKYVYVLCWKQCV